MDNNGERVKARLIRLGTPESPEDIEMLPGQRTSTFHVTAWFTGGPGPMWPGREVAELTKKLNQMEHIIASTAGSPFPMRYIGPPTAEADVNSKEEKK